jgi:hypothetical protein
VRQTENSASSSGKRRLPSILQSGRRGSRNARPRGRLKRLDVRRSTRRKLPPASSASCHQKRARPLSVAGVVAHRGDDRVHRVVRTCGHRRRQGSQRAWRRRCSDFLDLDICRLCCRACRAMAAPQSQAGSRRRACTCRTASRKSEGSGRSPIWLNSIILPPNSAATCPVSADQTRH